MQWLLRSALKMLEPVGVRVVFLCGEQRPVAVLEAQPICSLSDNLIAVPYQGEVLGRFNVCKSLIAWRMLLLFHLHRPAPSINQGLLELWDVGHVVAGNFIGLDAH
ncbi:hypothetical protein EJB05_05781, partial [Eragrostis curvula]